MITRASESPAVDLHPEPDPHKPLVPSDHPKIISKKSNSIPYQELALIALDGLQREKRTDSVHLTSIRTSPIFCGLVKKVGFQFKKECDLRYIQLPSNTWQATFRKARIRTCWFYLTSLRHVTILLKAVGGFHRIPCDSDNRMILERSLMKNDDIFQRSITMNRMSTAQSWNVSAHAI